MALYKNYLLGYYYQIVTKSLSGCLAQRDVTMFLVRVKFIGSSNLCFDNFVVHRGIGMCQFGFVLDCVLMTRLRGRYKAVFGACCLLDHLAYILISSQQALSCLVHLKERERESPEHSFKPTVLGSCSACWIVQCMCW